MECPMCKTSFSTVEEILIMVDRRFYCRHCWCRIVSYPDGKDEYVVEEDITGEKWRSMKKTIP